MSFRQNFDEAVRLYESGLSLGDLAARYSMTRQAMWKISNVGASNSDQICDLERTTIFIVTARDMSHIN